VAGEQPGLLEQGADFLPVDVGVGVAPDGQLSRGLAGLTVRRLADDLGLGVMTLYNYFRTKEDLLDEVCGHALSAVRADLDPTAPWDKQITTAIRDLHEALADNPGVVDIFVARSVYGPTLDHVRETLLGILRRAAFPKRQAVHALGAVVSYAVGFTLTERARSPKVASQSVGIRFQNLSDEEFSYLSDAGEDYLEYMSEGAFEYGLRHLVNSLRAELASVREAGGAQG
jgi:AcrR family transcriptional regulator